MGAITAIIPVFNAATYLDETLASLQAQTFTDWNCICVDDGSTDASLEVLERFAASDRRFSVVHSENGGVSKARNAGLAKADGKWIYFLDADDVAAPNALAVLHGLAERTSSDVAWGQYSRRQMFVGCEDSESRTYEGASLGSLLRRSYARGIPSERGAVFENVPSTVWNKLYSRRFLLDHGIMFDERFLRGEDLIFSAQVMRNARMAAATSAVTYFYRYVPKSLFLSGDYAGLTQMVDAVCRFAEEDAQGPFDMRGYMAGKWPLSWLRAVWWMRREICASRETRELFAADCRRLKRAFAGRMPVVSRMALSIACRLATLRT